MAEIGVNIAILDNGRVLLTQREDFEVWCLPGGAVDAGESVAQAARREAREETGLEVELTGLVGIYSQPHWNVYGSHIVVFAAHPVGGKLDPQPSEVLQARFFSPDEVPEALLVGQRRRIEDALSGVRGAVWSQNKPWPFEGDLRREELYARRDASKLTRQEYYQQVFISSSPYEETLEVKPSAPQDRA